MCLSGYLHRIETDLEAGNATEHTHRPALKTLLEELRPGVTATNEPQREKCGAPDYVVSRNAPHGPLTLGCVETKDVGRNLDSEEQSEQLQRYRRYLPNLVLTDYLEFRWYVDAERRMTARLARVGRDGRLRPDRDGRNKVRDLLGAFLDQTPQPVASPQDLAQRMARITHMIRDIVIQAFRGNAASEMLNDLRGAFARTLIPDLDQEAKLPEFADMYAQTLCYGLFAARCNHGGPKPFQRPGAASEIPRTNPFLRQLFDEITGTRLDGEPYAHFVDDLVQLLAAADIHAILENFGQRTARQDPVVHFYETFLAAYDPRVREMRGVYYTPEPVVSYIVRSVDHLLRTRFGCPDGLGDTSTCQYEEEQVDRNAARKRKVRNTAPRVLILDPACGTGTFLYTIVDLIRERFMKRSDAGMWSGYVRNHLLPRLFGFELLMAPYAVAHFKLGMQLAAHDLPDAQRKQWAYDFTGDERLGIFLTNTLEEAERRAQHELHFIERLIAAEADGAARIKRELPIMIVLGNPPYSGHSANRSHVTTFIEPGKEYMVYGEQGPKRRKAGRKGVHLRIPTFIGRLIQDYHRVDGQPLGERNPKWLQDDYVKFIRWGTWRIERTGAGVLAFITNHSYLDNPTFRGMRQHLMNTFTDIYVLDLHGNTKKKETCPDGSKDENVFDIQQGVAVAIFVKDPAKKPPGAVHHADLWGLRREKYRQLCEMDIEATPWRVLDPRPAFYLFIPRDADLESEYQAGRKVTEIFPVNSVGIVTARDALTIRWSADEMWRVVRDFASLPEAETREKYNLGRDVQDWTVSLAQKDVKDSGPSRGNVTRILYRPFDVRFTYYTGCSRAFLCRPRPEVMRHMLAGENLGVITTRQTRDQWDAFVTNGICGHKSCAAYDINTLLPLYLYPDPHRPIEASPWPAGKGGRRPNLRPDFVAELEQRLGLAFVPDGSGDLENTFGPEDVLHYIYAVLHAPTYRERYAEFLRIDFPRVPLTSNRDLFRTLCEKGRELVGLHLLESPRVRQFITRFPVKADNRVEKGHPKYLAPGDAEPRSGRPLKTGRVYISRDTPKTGRQGQYFEGVPPEVWEFQIGGYQVCEKWLKDRRGRTLSYEELEHYQKIVVAIAQTVRLMDEIDAAIPAWPLP